MIERKNKKKGKGTEAKGLGFACQQIFLLIVDYN
jgi:hypothetical protein